jgi:Rrf2 family protein
LKISQKGLYALQAIMTLGRRYGTETIKIRDIALDSDLPEKFLELILLELKNHRLLDSRKGRGGGYFLAKNPAQISAGQVLRALEGPLAPLPCASKTAYRRCEECHDERTCAVRMLMCDVREATAGILDSTTLKDLVERSRQAALGRQPLDFSI